MKKFLVVITNGKEHQQIVPIPAHNAKEAKEIAEKLPYCLSVEEVYQEVKL